MALPTVSESPATQRNYATQLTIAAALAQSVRGLWAALLPLSSPEALQSFGAASRVLVDRFAATAVVSAQDSYRSARRDSGLATVTRLPQITTPDPAKVAKELAWIERQVREQTAEALAELEAEILQEAVEAYEKAILDEARAYTVAAVEGDDQALGFRRVARPDACAWCLALATRKTSREGLAKDFKRYGAGGLGGDEHWGVYKSRASAGQLPPDASGEVNRFHFNCHCTVEPIFDLSFAPPQWLADVDAMYADSDDFNHFRRRLNALRRGEEPASPSLIVPPSAARPDQVAALANLLGAIDASMRAA